MPDDDDLLRRARLLDRDALTQIYDTHNDGIYRYALRLTGNEALAEDCVIEVFARVLRAFVDGRGPTEFLKPYLYRMAHNWSMDQHRRGGRDIELDDELVGPSEADDPLHLVERGMARDSVRRAFGTLTEDQQQVIALKYVEGWDNSEVARAVGKPVGAVKSLQHRALGALRRALAGAGQMDEDRGVSAGSPAVGGN